MGVMSSTAGAYSYTVNKGDTFWKIASYNGLSTKDLLYANNADQNSILYVGDTVYIPDQYIVKKGDTPWIISQKQDIILSELLELNHLSAQDYIYAGQKLRLPKRRTNQTHENTQSTDSTQDTYENNKNYKKHVVVKGDDYWKLSIQYGISYTEILKANNATNKSILNIGDIVKIPVHNIPVQQTQGENYGEYLDWFSQAQYVLPRGAVFKVTDFYTGKSFMVKRTTGSNHADCETLTKVDTQILKDIWGGYSWERRPILIEYKGRKLAASMSGMPHAGNDKVQGGVYTQWRSEGYGAGLNLDYVKGNDMDGVFDVHFKNSTRHKDGKIDTKHQECIKVAAGI